MQYFKLQLGCLVVIAFIMITYIKQTLKEQISCNRYFDLLMAFAPWAVFFDGLTAWTVNHVDTVPDILNRGAHLMFFLFMDVVVSAAAMYMLDQLLGIRSKKRILNLCIPGLISLVLVIAGIGGLSLTFGKITLTAVATSLILGIIVNLVLSGKKEQDVETEE